MAGAARGIITPPKGTYLVGYAERRRGCAGVHDDLYATALALSDGDRTLALVSCDLLCIHEDVVDRVRAAAGPEVEVVICCSHTHAGPITYAGPRAPRARREYVDLLSARIVDAINFAESDLAPARMFWSEGSAGIGVNRRERTADGRVVLGWNRGGPADKSVGILRVMRAEGSPVATFVNYACHGTILPPQNLLVSADWVGAMRARVEREIGGKVLFLQGAAGDINPDYEWGEGDPWEAVDRLGNAVAQGVLDAMAKESDDLAPGPLVISRREVLLPFETLSALQPAAYSLQPPTTYRRKVLQFAGVPTFFSFLTDRLLDRLHPWRPRLEFRNGTWCVPMRVNAIRIGDVSLVTFGAEVFTEIGKNIKAACPSPFTMFASVADGCIGYLPTAAAHDEGGYEVDDGPYLYRYPGRLARECERIAVETAKAAIHNLF
ncbi:MAG: neutral/alkaline non-lysosomal ceramidase N-terminal domain-containing protein [Deltaproteobacteria bacterium]|nr:neutral/alkaline non-lysosomal ceramidase N-terminal domain-containing protein [Deltaproteobacteria bacterium]